MAITRIITPGVTDDAVTSDKLNNDIISGTTALTSEPADTDEFLVSDAGTLKRIDYSLIKGGGITMVDNWRLSSSFTGSANPVASNWERNDSPAPSFGYYGSQMTESSGVFSFPSTGIYQIIFNGQWYLNGDTQYCGVEIHATSNNSSYGNMVTNYSFIKNVTNPTYTSLSTGAMFDITDTTNMKVRFRIAVEDSATTTIGESTYDHTFVRFIKLGDT
jgi:hypothetical protein